MIIAEIQALLSEKLTTVPSIDKIVLNTGFTGVLLSDGAMGIAMNVRSGSYASGEIEQLLSQLIGTDALTATARLTAEQAQSAEPKAKHLLRSVLLATYNALSKPFMNDDYLRRFNYRCIYGQEYAPADEIVKGETVTLVGFGGMVRPLAKKAQKVYVTELEPEIFRSRTFSRNGIVRGPNCAEIVQAANAREYFAKSDTVFVTGCTLVTDTMDEILQLCAGKKIVVYGGTAAFIPDVLLTRGVSSIRTTFIHDSALMVDLLENCAGAVERFFPLASENMIIVRA